MDEAGATERAACYGSGTGSEGDRMLLRQQWPNWDGTKAGFKQYWWKAEQVFFAAHLGPHLSGINKADAISEDKSVVAAYNHQNAKLFWMLLHMLGGNKPDAIQETMLLRIHNEFGDDRDGLGLVEYEKGYAKDITAAEVKLLKQDIDDITFKTNQTPADWDLLTQKLQEQWDRVPAHMRGGGTEALCEILLDKMPKSCQTYVQFVRAMAFSKGEIMNDYQGIAKVLLDQHTTNWATGVLSKGGNKVTEAHLTYQADSDDEAEAHYSQEGGRDSNGRSSNGRKPFGAKPMGKMLCHRCGEAGHYKKECTKKCSVCGLQQCGGVKTAARCMTKNGITAGLAKIMDPSIKKKIVDKAKEKGFFSSWGSASANMCEEDEPLTVEEFDFYTSSDAVALMTIDPEVPVNKYAMGSSVIEYMSEQYLLTDNDRVAQLRRHIGQISDAYKKNGVEVSVKSMGETDFTLVLDDGVNATKVLTMELPQDLVAQESKGKGVAEVNVETLCARCEVAGHHETDCMWADEVYDVVMLNKAFGDASSEKEIEESCPQMELNKYALGSSVIEYMSVKSGNRADLVAAAKRGRDEGWSEESRRKWAELVGHLYGCTQVPRCVSPEQFDARVESEGDALARTYVSVSDIKGPIIELRLSRGWGQLTRRVTGVITALKVMNESVEQGCIIEPAEVEKAMSEFLTGMSTYFKDMKDCGDIQRGSAAIVHAVRHEGKRLLRAKKDYGLCTCTFGCTLPGQEQTFKSTLAGEQFAMQQAMRLQERLGAPDGITVEQMTMRLLGAEALMIYESCQSECMPYQLESNPHVPVNKYAMGSSVIEYMSETVPDEQENEMTFTICDSAAACAQESTCNPANAQMVGEQVNWMVENMLQGTGNEHLAQWVVGMHMQQNYEHCMELLRAPFEQQREQVEKALELIAQHKAERDESELHLDRQLVEFTRSAEHGATSYEQLESNRAWALNSSELTESQMSEVNESQRIIAVFEMELERENYERAIEESLESERQRVDQQTAERCTAELGVTESLKSIEAEKIEKDAASGMMMSIDVVELDDDHAPRQNGFADTSESITHDMGGTTVLNESLESMIRGVDKIANEATIATEMLVDNKDAIAGQIDGMDESELFDLVGDVSLSEMKLQATPLTESVDRRYSTPRADVHLEGGAIGGALAPRRLEYETATQGCGLFPRGRGSRHPTSMFTVITASPPPRRRTKENAPTPTKPVASCNASSKPAERMAARTNGQYSVGSVSTSVGSAGRSSNRSAQGSSHGPDMEQPIPKPKPRRASALNRNPSEARGGQNGKSTEGATTEGLVTPNEILTEMMEIKRAQGLQGVTSRKDSGEIMSAIESCKDMLMTAQRRSMLLDAKTAEVARESTAYVPTCAVERSGGQFLSSHGNGRGSAVNGRRSSLTSTRARGLRASGGLHTPRTARSPRNRAAAAGWGWMSMLAMAGIAAAVACTGAAHLGAATTSASEMRSGRAPIFVHEQRGQEARAVMMSAGENGESSATADEGTAVIDGGCTNSAWKDRGAFEEGTLTASTIPNVLVGDGKRLDVKAEGTVSVMVEGTNGKAVPYRRHHVLYVPDLHRNLISERQEWEMHATRIVKEDVRTMTWPIRGNKSAAVARIRDAGKLYVLRYKNRQAQALTAEVESSAEQAYRLWHARLGDAHPRKMKLIGETTEGTPLANISVAAMAKKVGVCSHCARGKMRRMHVGEAKEKVTRPHQMVQMDVWGKYRVASAVNKSYYAIAFVDVATGHIMVYPRASHTASGLIDCCTLYMGDMGAAFEILRTDNGPEMLSDQFQMWLAEQKITWQRSTRYVHEEIGHVERRWGMLVPMARTMLLRANMEKRFWADAMMYSAWIWNRTPDTVHGEETACTGAASTPHERMYSKRPNLSKARIFGCKAWAYLDKEERDSKMHEVSVEGRFVGMEPNGAGWLIYANGRYYASRRAVFDEKNVLLESTAVSDDSAGAVEVPAFEEEEEEPRASRSRVANVGGAAEGADEVVDQGQPEISEPVGSNEITVNDLGAPVGEWIEVWWTGELKWFEAQVLIVNTTEGGKVQHQVYYPVDTKTLWHHLQEERWRLSTQGPSGLAAEACYILNDDMVHGGVWPDISNAPCTAECLTVTNEISSSTCDTWGDGVHGSYAIAYVSSVDRVKYVIMPTGMAAITIPVSHKEAMASLYCERWKQAEECEIDTLESMGTYDWLYVRDMPTGEKLYRSKWAYDCKTVDGVLEKFKARLCFVGIEQREGSYEAVFSNCVRYASIRCLIAFGAVHDYEIFNVDIKGAYLSQEMDRDLFMRPPPGHEKQGPRGEVMCVVLRRALYGCKQSGRLFRKGLDLWLRGYGFEPMMHDDCMYVRHGVNDSHIMIGVWVDDIIAAASTPEVRQEFIAALREEFSVDDRGDLEWALGLKVQRDRRTRTITISCGSRIRALGEKYGIDLKTNRKYETPADSAILDMEDGEEINLEAAEKCRALIGALMYISSTCRPDVAHSVHRLARMMSRPNKKVWACSLRTLVYLLGCADQGITYGGGRPESLRLSAVHKPFESPEGGGLAALSDANWEVGPSVSGYLVMLANAAVAWCSKKQPSTSLSSTEAETFAAAAATSETLWARGLLAELGAPQAGPTVLWVDNSGAVAIASDAASIGRSRHIARRANFCLEANAGGAVRQRWLSTEANVADVLTKPLDRKRFIKLRGYMMNHDAQQENETKRGGGEA